MPADPNAFVRVLDEFLWTLRREGLVVSTAQALDIARAVEAVGLEHRANVRDAIACVVVDRPTARSRFNTLFDAFFSPGSTETTGTLWQRLQARGFDLAELDALRALLIELDTPGAGGGTSFRAILDRGADLNRLLVMSGIAAAIDAHSALMLGFLTHRLAAQVGVARARGTLATLRAQLAGVLGDRGLELATALAYELDRAEDDIRAFVRRAYDMRVAALDVERSLGRAHTAPFASLADAQIEEVRRAVRRFAERLRGAARVRARRARRGRIDPHRTLRRAVRTGGVPYVIVHKERRRDRPKLMVLCDVSDSVRAVASFLLEFTYAAQELFERARTFAFVSDLCETTDLFARQPVRTAIDEAWCGGAVVRGGDNSNYGRVLRTFEARHLREVDRATTVVILGDGRTNYHQASPEVLDRIRACSHALVWLCPEARGQWTVGDSAMTRYAPKCSAVLEVRSARDLENAARTLVSLS
jgi:uncharacterized protein with von Willebrand factor type A (vWA) domain